MAECCITCCKAADLGSHDYCCCECAPARRSPQSHAKTTQTSYGSEPTFSQALSYISASEKKSMIAEPKKASSNAKKATDSVAAQPSKK